MWIIDSKGKLNDFYRKLKRNHQWIGFFIVVLALLYAFVSVLFEPKHIALDITYGVFFACLIYGLYHAFINEREKSKAIRIFKWENAFTIVGVFATYSLVHLFDISVVIASSFIGLLGHFLLKKYEVPIYCGSFAGMVSVALFGFFEVAILALVCAFVYAHISPLFSGYGGKLGTIAFISSLIVHSLFLDEFAVVDTDFHLLLLLLTALVGVVSTFYLQHQMKTSAVFASALTSSVFALLVIYALPAYAGYAIVFFSASFIGMSSKKRLPGAFFVVFSGLTLGFVYYLFVSLFNGLGGKLGLMAFISVIITMSISKVYEFIKDLV